MAGTAFADQDSQSRKVEEYYDNKFEEKRLTKALEDYEAEQMRQAKIRYYSKDIKSTSGGGFISFLLNALAWILAAFAAVFAGGTVWIVVKTLFEIAKDKVNRLVGKVRIPDHPDLKRPPVPTPESIGLAQLNRNQVPNSSIQESKTNF